MRKTKEDAEQTRSDILNAAASVFICKGFPKSSLEEIARQANVTRGAVYWHFKNKAEIFDALHQQLYSPLAEQVHQDLQREHPDPLDQLREFTTNLMLNLDEEKLEQRVLRLFLMKQNYSGELAEYKDIHYQRKVDTLKLFERYFEKANELGKLRPGADIPLLAKSLNYFFRGIMSEYMEYPEKFELKERVPALFNLFFTNLIAGQGAQAAATA